MQITVFKKYDIRGIIDQEIAVEETYRLAQAIIAYFKQKNPQLSNIILGMDGRTHSPLIKEQVCKAVLNSGINVTFIGTCSTPLFYFANEILQTDGGIMITASHNPKNYNGIKLMLNKKSVFDQDIIEIKNLFYSQTHFTEQQPGIYKEQSLVSEYIRVLSDQFAHLKGKPIKAVIDCAHGATAVIIPELINQMEWDHIKLMYATIDGNFPAHEADPTKEENILELRQNLHNEYIGISFDGDGDRMGALTENGRLLRGDELTALFCQAIKKEVGPFKMVADIKCAHALLKEFQSWDLTHILTPCGIGFVREAIRKNHALFGGELSCHFCFNDRYFGFDDGIYAMMRLLEIIDKEQCQLNALYKKLPPCYCSAEMRLLSTHELKNQIVEDIKTKLTHRIDLNLVTIDGIRAELPYGCATIRSSNTEPMLSVRFEGTTQKNLDQITDEFYTLLIPYFEKEYLTKILKKPASE